MTSHPLKHRALAVIQWLHEAIFGRISAVPFGLFRMGWAAAAFIGFLAHWPRLTLFYSDQGVFPPELASTYARSMYHFTLLSYVHAPAAVAALFLLMMLSFVSMFVGFRTRLATIFSVVLLFSFQEQSYALFAGGDIVLRVAGFILMIAPGIEAISFDRLLLQETQWIEKKSVLPRFTMPIWPRLMLTWQMVVIYVAAAWNKLLDPMWRDGLGTVASMNHVEFARFGRTVGDVFAYFTVPFSWGTISWQLSWVIFLIPLRLRRKLPPRLRAYRRWMLAVGVTFHLLILILMDAGVFSLAMFATYFGVLDQDDYDGLRDWINRQWQWKGTVHVFYDSHCGFCRRMVLPLLLGDWLQHVTLIDFHDAKLLKATAPDLSLKALDDALHVRFPDGRTAAGFDGIRMLTWHLPWAWPVAPFLYLPGVAPIGRWAYRKVAANRHCLIGGPCQI